MRKVDTFAPHNDGHQWRKYGEKKINNTNFPRSGRRIFTCSVSSSFVTSPWGRAKKSDSASARVFLRKKVMPAKNTPLLANLPPLRYVCFFQLSASKPAASSCSFHSHTAASCPPSPPPQVLLQMHVQGQHELPGHEAGAAEGPQRPAIVRGHLLQRPLVQQRLPPAPPLRVPAADPVREGRLHLLRLLVRAGGARAGGRGVRRHQC
jgi:hypothetical protein